MKLVKFEQYLNKKDIVKFAQASRTTDRDLKAVTIQLRNLEFQRMRPMREENNKLKRVVIGMSVGLVHMGRYDTMRPRHWGDMLRGMVRFLNYTFALDAINGAVYDIANSHPNIEGESVELARDRIADLDHIAAHMDPIDYLQQGENSEDWIIAHHLMR